MDLFSDRRFLLGIAGLLGLAALGFMGAPPATLLGFSVVIMVALVVKSLRKR